MDTPLRARARARAREIIEEFRPWFHCALGRRVRAVSRLTFGHADGAAGLVGRH